MWTDLEQELKVNIPTYLSSILEASGFDNLLSLTQLNEASVKEIEEFARGTLLSIIDKEDVPKYYGLFKNKPDKFVILPGHCKLISSIAKYATKAFIKLGEKDDLDDTISIKTSDNVNIEDQCTLGINPSCSQDTISPNIEKDKNHLERNLRLWLENQIQIPNKKLSIEDVEVNVIASKDLESNLSTAAVTCKMCQVTIKLVMVNPGRKWLPSNFHRHVNRFHVKSDENQAKKKLSTKKPEKKSTFSKLLFCRSSPKLKKLSTSQITEQPEEVVVYPIFPYNGYDHAQIATAQIPGTSTADLDLTTGNDCELPGKTSNHVCNHSHDDIQNPPKRNKVFKQEDTDDNFEPAS